MVGQIKLSYAEELVGKSTGAEIRFQIDGTDNALNVYTTRCDTVYGVTFMVMAPEHPLC